MEGLNESLPKNDSSLGISETPQSAAPLYAAVNYPRDKCIHHLFEAQVEKMPDNVAVVLGDMQITYRELNAKSNQLGRYLQKRGVKPETLVGIYSERSIDIIIAILGVLKAGGAYVPMDPDYPEDRVAYMLEDSGCPVVLTQTSLLSKLPATDAELICLDDWTAIAGESAENVASHAKPTNLAYVIYTSGSTGKPKGVLIENYNVVRLLVNDHFQFDFSARDTWTIFHSFCFDFSVWEMYGALLFGGKAVIIPKETARDPLAFIDILIAQKVTVLNQTPSAFYNLIPKMLELPAAKFRLRYVIFGGEGLNYTKLKKIKQTFPEIMFINMYGITETTVHVTYKEVTFADIKKGFSNIGTPIPTLTTYIFDENLQPVPIGVEGEMCVGGDGVARGYLNREELTREKFIPNPMNPKEIIYRSGDLACMHESGELEYLGRIDNQIQLRGFRIELGEIETVINAMEEIKDCVVVAKEDANGNKRLVAYIIFETIEITADKIRERITHYLPDYMLPSFFIKISEFPLTSNGKLDSKKLPEPDIGMVSAKAYTAPANETEAALTRIWGDILDIAPEKISTAHNFFDIGGNSLAAAAVAQSVQKVLGKRCTPRYIYEYPSIAQLAHTLQDIEPAAEPEETASLPTFSGNIPLQSAQLAIWMMERNVAAKFANVCEIFEIEGPFDTDLFQTVFSETAKRHDSLWCPFSAEIPVAIRKEPTETALRVIDISSQSRNRQNEVFQDTIAKVLQAPFDITNVPLFRVSILKQQEEKHFLFLSLPHIICDSASLIDFTRELFDTYAVGRKGKPLAATNRPRTTVDELVSLEKAYLKGDAFKQSYRFWEEKLSKTPLLTFSRENFVEKNKTTGKKRLTEIKFSPESIEQLQQLALKNNTTLQMAVLALIKASLSTFTKQKDISTVMIFDTRGNYAKPPVMSLNASSIIVRNIFSESMTYTELLTTIKWAAVDALNHLKFPHTLINCHTIANIVKDNSFYVRCINKLSTLIYAWRWRKARVSKPIVGALISHYIGYLLTVREMEKQEKNVRLAPTIVFNVSPDFYEEKCLWSDDMLSVTNIRDRELTMDRRVFEDTCEFNDSKVLNFDLTKNGAGDVMLHIWGGELNGRAFKTLEKAFLDHLERMTADPEAIVGN